MLMATHDHQLHEGKSLKDAARTRLMREGEQWTDMREAVFAALAGFDKPASAYDIAEAVSTAKGRRVAANSVYRILDLFVSSNLAGGSRARTPMSPTPTPSACTTAFS